MDPRQNDKKLQSLLFQMQTDNSKPLEGMTLLLVEDTLDNQLLMSKTLKRFGAEVDVASNGAEAIAKAGLKTYDVVLMDIQMPILNGYDAMAALRAKNYLAPVVALTAHAMREERDKALEMGFDDYLTKPLDRAVLLQTLTRLKGAAQAAAKPAS